MGFYQHVGLKGRICAYAPKAFYLFLGPKKIHVRNIARTSSKDSLTLYFESKRNFRRELSVEEVDYEQGKGEAVITFKHVEGQSQGKSVLIMIIYYR